MQPKKKNALVGMLTGFLILALVLYPLIFNATSEFGGADDQAEGVIAELAPGYEPWVEPFFEPPSAEVESLLFCLQAALGAGVIGYYLAYARYNKHEKER